jgi:hypothetical protein
LAQSLEEPLKSAAERVKDALGRHLLTCKPDEMVLTRSLIHATDQLALALGNIIADGKMAEREIAAIESGRHKIYGLG